MIGFDLDGILIPDYSEKGNLQDYLKARVTFFKPIFDLKKLKDVCVVTGRPGVDFEDTYRWFKEYFPNIELFHNDFEKESSKYFKEKIINENDIKLFFESDLEQVEYLKNHTDAKIIHWETFLLENIQKEINFLNSKENQ